MSNSISEDELIAVCGKIGKILLTSGAETARVESTVEYIGRAAHFEITCHATITALFVGVKNQTKTHLVKARLGDFNLQKVDEINTTSREFVTGKIDFTTLEEKIDQIDRKVIDFNWPLKILGAGMVSVAPMLLFKATWSDLSLAFFVGIIGYLIAVWAGKHIMTPYVAAGCGGFIIGFLAALLETLGIATSAGNIIVSALMPLVPGVAITNSFREIIDRNTISGLVRAVDAIIIAGSIGAGVVIGMSLCSMITGIVGG
ncbi:threonine/serine exporter family protein [Lentilactobacillus diolivorans]|uniref:threonine/serine exporter family protein n=1 Tax=Lentilactobacillus diolivorans TaxID=179838 RepID=UPI0024696505|nr:threonine/serine exporter family protein [Lentilactobacillus diolivorans]MDH5105481.1 threonine/serine exporter family protein [Lentilactobacillus diolivorans]